MPRRKHVGLKYLYKRRSQVYNKLRCRRLDTSQYLVIHEPTKTEYIVIKQPEDGHWAVMDPQDSSTVLFRQRTKNKVMELLAARGPRAVKIA